MPSHGRGGVRFVIYAYPLQARDSELPLRGVLRRLHLLQTLHKRADSAAYKRSRLKVAVSNASGPLVCE